MAPFDDISSDETFFQQIINDSVMNANTYNESEVHESTQCRRKSKRTKKPKEAIPDTQKSLSEETIEFSQSQKENAVPNNKTNKKNTKKQVKRQPLAELNGERKTRRGVSTKKKEEEKKNVEEAIKEEKENVFKIAVCEENPTEDALSKSKPVTNRWSILPDERKSSVRVVVSPKNKKSRYSLNDFSNSKFLNEKKNKIESLSPFSFEKKVAKPKLLSKPTPTPEEMEEIFGKLEVLFPEVDPEFLRAQCTKLKGSLHDTVDLVSMKEKTGELPSRADYLKRLETERMQNDYRKNFKVENYLKIIPDPWEYFLIKEKHNCVKYAEHSFFYLKNKFKKHYIQAIQEVFVRNDCSLYLSHKELQKKNRILKMRATNRSKLECDAGKPTTFNMQFMHEVALIENESKIKTYLKKAEVAKYKRFLLAEKSGDLVDCQSCQESGLLEEDTVGCSADHVFCKDCLTEFMEIEVQEENFWFKCILKCEEKLPMEPLSDLLGTLSIAGIIERKKEEKNGKIFQNLTSCPFCYYIVVLPSESTIFRCFNPNCMLESCRCCKQLNHHPQKCAEQQLKEKEEPGAVNPNSVSICIHCQNEFVQGDNDKELVCPCGSTICSVCRQPYPDCPHFVDDAVGPRGVPEPGHSSDDAEFLEAVGEATDAGASDPPAQLPRFSSFTSTDSDCF